MMQGIQELQNASIGLLYPLWSNSVHLYIRIIGKSRPSHEKIETKWIGSTFFVLLTRTVPAQRKERNTKTVLFLLAMMMTVFSANAYDFSAVCSTGQTLYYNFVNNGTNTSVEVTAENAGINPNYSVRPTGVLVIPSSVTYGGTIYYVTAIGWYAFHRCAGLVSVTIPNTVVSIGEYAFQECSGLSNVNIPNSVVSIGRQAFYQCQSLINIAVPNSVNSIGYYAFAQGITNVYYGGMASGSPWGATNHYPYYYSENNLFYEDSLKTILCGCSDGITNLNIPNSVVRITDNAFVNRTDLTSVLLGDSLTTIGNNAFMNCTNLVSVLWNSNVDSIGHSAFSGCAALSSVNLPNSIVFLGDNAFSNCTSLTTAILSNNLNTINGTFNGCTNLTNITLPNSITSIGYGSFRNCTSLSSVNLGNGITTIGNEAFYGCTSLATITLPNTLISIGDQSFGDCSSLSEIIIPESVTNIGWAAFVGCSNITTVNFNAISCSQTGYSFQSLPNLTTLNIGTNVQYIPPYMFRACTGLVSLNIPNAVTEIADGVFTECSNLTSVTIGNGLSNIGNNAFSQCTRLTNVSLGESIETIGNSAFLNCGIIGELVIPQGVISIGNNGFKDCFGITEITCLGRVAPTLGTDAFDGVDTSITVNIPCGTTNLYAGRWAYFHNFNEIPFLFNVASANIAQGTVAMLQEPTCNDPVAIVEATPRNGYRFDHWSDGSTANPYTYTAMGSLTLTAYFASTTEGIEDIDDSGIIVYAKDYKIHIYEAFGEEISVYTIDGRTIASLPRATEHVAIPVTTTGVYIVKIGNHPARKVVIIK